MVANAGPGQIGQYKKEKEPLLTAIDIKETLKQLHRRQDELHNALEKAGGEDVLLNTISDIEDRSSSM